MTKKRGWGGTTRVLECCRIGELKIEEGENKTKKCMEIKAEERVGIQRI